MSTLTKAGRYELREELGRGAMGVVYRAQDPVIGRDVAVKTMHLSEAGTGMSREELVGRFQTEARAAGLLTHPNIVVIYDAGEEEGLFYITMELVQGRSLQSLLDARQLFPLPRVMKLMEQVCSALDFAHQHNVVHRDIKPANLVLTEDDTVKITDFGTAKILQFGTAQTAHVMGTPSYMSPEQVKGKPVDGRSDIFSLGVILYELMTGEKPFPGQNITTVIYKIINEEPIPPRSLDSSIHPGLSSVITRALSKDPATRFQTCHELLEALKNYREMVSPETTVRMAPVKATPGGEGTRAVAATGRAAAAPLVPRPNGPDSSTRLHPAIYREEDPSKQRGNLVLSLILLAIIGYSSYRIYPAMRDLWQRAKEADQSLRAQKIRTIANPMATAATPAAKPQAVPVAPAPDASPAPNAASPVKSGAVPQSMPAPPAVPPPAAQSPAAQTRAVQPDVPIVLTGNDGSAKDAGKPAGAPKALPVSQASPAALFDSDLQARLERLQIADKVKTQVIGSAITLSGRLNAIEHRRLLNQLHAVPAGVRIIDDIEYASDLGGASGLASTGWAWVRSEPRGAEIMLDAKDTGLRTPARLEVPQGQHEIQLVLSGFTKSDRTVEISPSRTMQVIEILEKQ
ncbi:MAG: serine/threonine-protein kinase [Candidatus Acidiferrales bacterium]